MKTHPPRTRNIGPRVKRLERKHLTGAAFARVGRWAESALRRLFSATHARSIVDLESEVYVRRWQPKR